MKHRRFNRDLVARAAVLLALYLGFSWYLPNYFTAPGFATLLDGAVLTGLVAVGVGLTMIAGELDLSVGSMAALAGVITIELITGGVNPAMALGVVVAVAVAFGALQGLAINLLGINSLVFTIGTLIGLRGIALIAANETTQVLPISLLSLADAVSQRFLVFTPLSLTMIAAFVLAGAFASRTLWGRDIYAIGGGRNEARAAGVPMRRPIVLVFACSAGFAALAGGLLSIRSGGATPLAYDAVLLEAITACLIGGVALSGGRGTFTGIFIGLCMLRVVISGIAGLGAPFWAQNLAAGLLLIVVIAGETISRSLLRRARRSVASAA